MTARAEATGWSYPVRVADVPLGPERLWWVLHKVQRWRPYVDGSVLDDVAVVLDHYTPGEEEAGDIALRLRGHLMRLVNLAVASKVDFQHEQVAELVERARAPSVPTKWPLTTGRPLGISAGWPGPSTSSWSAWWQTSASRRRRDAPTCDAAPRVAHWNINPLPPRRSGAEKETARG
ncbi:DUF6415 family natural product biosynthesis protein [Streptomyces justiciae]|uniref:DUF6415 family natural product biosynthesis protein n=1 Tax=Streptomyces justiciae TaxID=2780140 RepID=UPI0021199365|nr:DUF6415 family natural product biosynthesis protein [Streptomyces justiciae]MCW8382365.1 DUF6415 family natural product biosynthesis protein [Streptomyces justiciae]